MRTTMNNEMNEKKAVTLEDLLMELVKEGKAVRIPIGKAAIQPDKAEEELPNIDVDEMLVQIKQSTGLCMKIEPFR